MRPALVILAVTATLATVEGLAWWWMNPPAAATGEPVLAYRPGIRSQESTGSGSVPSSKRSQTGMAGSQRRQAGDRDQEETPAQDASNKEPGTRHSGAAATTAHSDSPSQLFRISAFQFLPDIYRQAAPMLRCSDGEVFRIDTDDHLTLHLAWFEWNDTDTGSVLEAFRHMPEACLGSLGMKLVSKEKPIRYVVRGQESGDRSQGPGTTHQAQSTRHQAQDTSSTSHFSLHTSHSSSPTAQSRSSKSKIQNPKFATQSLSFDHTIFQETDGADSPLRTPVHSFRAVWVSGMDEADARQGIGGHEFERLRTIRLKAALDRYRPRHARVIQGTVRGALTAESAWQAFEHHMLRHLTIEESEGPKV